ncbi:MgtC/SapB family protein [Paenibacillus aurantius]|uniref:MgtC/SapB family protein n=1 Tax=Paenibacillus aurantius TaxID=2918900 RepID=A0AA96LJN6_9BACL|nr:MgtC/SapB family protein [Paenibacillus aurantius]WNQ13336.1 MgtC/SapB family protein [Paenibacillus aurantius]
MSGVWYISDWHLTIRLLLAALCGGLIGLEREWNHHAAGFRTHILVCIGSAAIMLLSIYGFSQFVTEENVRMDPARLAAQVISGIGFLGAGAIMRTGATVSGLTTAASIWVVAAIGLCVGAGFYYCAGLATLLVLVSLFLLNKWEKVLMRDRRHQEVTIKIFDRPGSLGRIATEFGLQGIQIANVNMTPEEKPVLGEKGEPVMELRFRLKFASGDRMVKALEGISKTGDVLSIESKWSSSQTVSRMSSPSA